ncbi:MAG: DegT/DnrJ/EryC1/StrS family aminotransferase, partial [Planctomycetaceae bacterium]|nr:DegT/DnrJ/EryC1/StrS family aminotransferase [Planctomycetaceae bacterium]
MIPRFVVVSEKQEGPREKVQALIERCAKESIECVSAGEAEFAEYSGVKHCIGVGNGLEALHLLLRAYGVGPGDEV